MPRPPFRSLPLRSELCLLLALSLSGLAGCGSADSTAAPQAEAEPTTPASALEELRAHVTELMARPEKTVETIEVQHLLVGFDGSGTKATRTKAEAEQLAADLFARIRAGEDFEELLTQYTDDQPPGIYSMTMGEPTPGVRPRQGLVPAFGNVGWRLDVGDFGVAVHDTRSSPYGWHIIKRTR